jgi:HD superfamily phosphohydrolase
MGKTWPRLIRDPVHDIIPFDNNDCDRLLLELINTPEFQRLRRIKQLGMSELVFPGANHSRFAHSIGVMHNARRFIQRIEQLTGKPVEERHRTGVLVAALLHDLGHGPFSHTFEKITEESHEKRTIEIICDDTTTVNEVLRKHGNWLPDLLRRFFDEDTEISGDGLPEYLVQIISSQLDADRFDYLLRDSHASGAGYGEFDSNWIIQHLQLGRSGTRLQLSSKALVAAETYVYARYHMYRAVYFHKTTRAAEVMLRLLFDRFKALIALGGDATTAAAPNAPAAIVSAFRSNGRMSLDDYLLLDDHTVTEFVKCCRKGDDPEMGGLAAGLLERRLFKSVDATDAEKENVPEFYEQAKHALMAESSSLASLPVKDAPTDTPYKPYDPDAEEPATQIYIEDTLGAVKEFGELSAGAKALKAKYGLLRYYFPAEHRGRIEEVAQRCFGKGKNNG